MILREQKISGAERSLRSVDDLHSDIEQMEAEQNRVGSKICKLVVLRQVLDEQKLSEAEWSLRSVKLLHCAIELTKVFHVVNFQLSSDLLVFMFGNNMFKQ